LSKAETTDSLLTAWPKRLPAVKRETATTRSPSTFTTSSTAAPSTATTPSTTQSPTASPSTSAATTEASTTTSPVTATTTPTIPSSTEPSTTSGEISSADRRLQNRLDFDQQALHHRQDVEQQTSGSARVVTFHIQDVRHPRVIKSPRDVSQQFPDDSAGDKLTREEPQFFVPPIRRKASRRRVPLTSQNRAGSGQPSLGDLLAEQIRQQLAKLEAEQGDRLQQQQQDRSRHQEEQQQQQEEQQQQQQQQQQQEEQQQRDQQYDQREAEGESRQAVPATPTTAKPYEHPFIPSSPTTTSEPYRHPFIPKSPTTTSEPYVHPWIPKSPTTTDKPYVHPFIPKSPTTTDKPYVHPFIPQSPTTTDRPYRHPFIPVPPETTGRPHGGPHGEPAAPAPQQHRAEVPQARRIPDATLPRLHLPRTKPTPTTHPPSTSTAASAAGDATVVHHQERMDSEGFIVGEYGEVRHGGTVRGVQYTADSSVDRSLLDAALQQFLRL